MADDLGTPATYPYQPGDLVVSLTAGKPDHALVLTEETIHSERWLFVQSLANRPAGMSPAQYHVLASEVRAVTRMDEGERTSTQYFD